VATYVPSRLRVEQHLAVREKPQEFLAKARRVRLEHRPDVDQERVRVGGEHLDATLGRTSAVGVVLGVKAAGNARARGFPLHAANPCVTY
jgi:hypothetical protein